MFSALFHLLTGQWIPRNVWNFLLRKLRPGAYEVHGSAATVSVAPWPPKLRASKLQCPMFGVSEFFHKLNLNLSNEFCRISKWQIYGIPILRVFFWTEYSPIFRICVDHLEHHEHTLQKGGGGCCWRYDSAHICSVEHYKNLVGELGPLDQFPIRCDTFVTGTWLFVSKNYDDSIDVVFFPW